LVSQSRFASLISLATKNWKLTTALWPHGREQWDQALRQSGVSENGVAQNCVGEAGNHRDLDGRDEFSRAYAKKR
jgi:hypothetical protein